MKLSMMMKAAIAAKNQSPNISKSAKKIMDENGLSIDDVATRNKNGNIGKKEVETALIIASSSTSSDEEE